MRPHLPRIARNLRWLIAGDVFVKGSLLMMTILIARGLGPVQAGVFAVSLGAALVAIPLFACGQAEVLIRETARQPQHARSLLAAARRTQYHLLSWLLPITLGSLWLVVDRDDLRWSLLAFLPYVLFRMEIFTRGAVFKGLDRMDVEAKARGIEASLGLTLIAALASLDGPIWSPGLALSLGAGFGLAWLIRRQAELPPDPETSPLHFLLHQGLPFIGLGAGLQLLLRADIFFLTALGLARELIGFYGAAAILVWGLLALPQLVALSLYPTVSRLASRGHRPSLSALIAVGLGLGIGLPAAAALSWLREPLVDLLFGSEFEAASRILGRLAWALPGAGTSMLLGIVLAAWHRQTRGLGILVSTLSVSVSLNLLWIPKAGVMGAAAAAVVAHSAGAVANFLLAVRPGRIPGEVRAR